jgi:hypothetical protein
VSRVRLVIALGVVALARAAAAEPCGDAGALRAELEQESARADHWVLAWRIAYTALAVGELGGAVSGVADHDNTLSLWVGGAKSTLGALGVWLSPLRIDVPPPTGDACTDRAALRATAERAAADERRSFWLLSTYTMPRASWGRVREPAWTAGVVASGRQYAVVVAGAF